MNDAIFNTHMEIGLHCLFILNAMYPNFCTLERIAYIDYLSLYIEDYQSSGTNLHPKYPFQSIEAFEKLNLLKNSILNLTLKGLIDVDIEQGLQYRANSNTAWLINSIDNSYSNKLTHNIKAIIEDTKTKSDKDLKHIILSQTEASQNTFNNFYPFYEEVQQ